MFPLLQSGDIVEYIQLPFHKIYLNDIILVHVNNIPFTHRVIYKTKTTYVTRGDNNEFADTEVKKRRVLAKVIRFQRKGVWHEIGDVYLTQSAFYLHEIQKLEAVLNAQKVPHVFLKGVLVSLRYEGKIPRRIYADCDILISRTYTQKTHNVFKTLGYLTQEPALRQLQRLPKGPSAKPEVNFMKVVGGVPVVFDVHFEPVFLMTQIAGMNFMYPPNKLKKLGEHIIANREMKKVQGFIYPLCSAPDQILYLALHIFHHNFTDSVRYQLLDSIIRKTATKNTWSLIRSAIKSYQLEGYLSLVFILLKKYYHTPIPPSFLAGIRPHTFKKWVLNSMECHINIFSQENGLRVGIMRFFYAFLLSPEPFLKKIIIFVHPQVCFAGLSLVWLSLVNRWGVRRSMCELPPTSAY